MKTLEQERAKFAYEKVKSVKGRDFEEDYAKYVKNAPAMILTNGLGNTLAYYRSKKREAYTKLYEHFGEWLQERGYCKKDEDVLEWITKTDSLIVFQATQEVLALLNWMTKFARAELKESDSG
ncbi:type III-B CRISPR module-associated protein Cmr5 [Ferroglobus sp.]|uniref:type III-B CRISPR module-associated protein Cmr5 n=1 Tax=Ferroglobus sp. TaxID=2614230 RepID=UPI0025BDC20E|nr:type III-B CRISPR module-associated protein Cmr5 [Ferroglobus sp.]